MVSLFVITAPQARPEACWVKLKLKTDFELFHVYMEPTC